jgi:5'-3' exonuclease
MNEAVSTFICSLLGSSAIFGFIQFLITRKDNQKKEEEDLKLTSLKQDILVNFTEQKKVSEARYLEQKEVIKDLAEQHEEESKKIQETFQSLKDSDINVAQSIDYLTDSLKALVKDRLVYLTNHYQERGAITIQEKSNLMAIYKPYHSGLHGNGQGQIGYEMAMGLPVVTDDVAEQMDRELKKRKAGESI